MRRIGVFVVAVVAVVVLAACDWAQPGFGPDQTNFNPSEPAITPTSVTRFHLDWSTQCGICRNPALVAGGLLYFSSESPTSDTTQTVEARDLATGAVRWSTTFLHVDDAEFLGIGNGLAYVRVGSLPGDGAQNTSDVLLAYDAATGKLRWGYVPPSPGGPPTSLPITIQNWVLDGPLLFVVTATPTVGYAVTAIDATGHDVWGAPVPGTVQGVVADPGHTLHVVSFVRLHPDDTGTGILTSLAEPTGHVDATRYADFGPYGLVFGSPPALANGLIYAESNANTLQGNHERAVAVRVATGVQAWSELDESIGAVAPGAVVTLGAAGVVARNPATGGPMWSAPGSAFGGPVQPAAVTDGIVFADQGGMRAFRLSDGTVLGTAAAGGMITVAQGHVVATPSGFGDLRVLTPTG